MQWPDPSPESGRTTPSFVRQSGWISSFWDPASQGIFRGPVYVPTQTRQIRANPRRRMLMRSSWFCAAGTRTDEMEVGIEYPDTGPRSPRPRCGCPDQLMRRATANGRSHSIGLGFFPTASVAHRFFVFTAHLGYDGRLPTKKGPGQGYPRVEYGHRWPKHCERGYKHHTSKPRLRLGRHSSHHDPGEFSIL